MMKATQVKVDRESEKRTVSLSVGPMTDLPVTAHLTSEADVAELVGIAYSGVSR